VNSATINIGMQVFSLICWFHFFWKSQK
jgi:hypothetical protein